MQGKVQLLNLPEVPQPLKQLLEGQDHEAKEFCQNIRKYNAAFAFTSLGANFDQQLLQEFFYSPYVLKLQGELYHIHGSLRPNPGSKIKYAQLYIYDPALVLAQRIDFNVDLSPTIMGDLQEMLLLCNPHVTTYKQAAERLRAQGQEPGKAHIQGTQGS
ncbi:hypothetical protein JB92DRAFT_3154163 [Gautieria morchelliformis]|nr:hypothetical protein JB92DRAFT_3154163 [Gautieria morchelliformis]